MKAIFLDKDGTLIKDVPHNVNPDLIELSKRAGEGLHMLQQHGYRLFIITNQPGVAKGLFAEDALGPIEARITELLSREQVVLDGFYYCPHHPEGTVGDYAAECDCRKPKPGLILRVAREHGVDLAYSWMIGDILHDVEAGKHAGCRTVLIDNGNETEWQISTQRIPDLVVPDLAEAAFAIAEYDKAGDSDGRKTMAL
jgi:D-glycero-D-manno-heptose 1,7-bisphosphate phosphatase